MLNQYAEDNSHDASQPAFSHLFKILVECKAVVWECLAATMGRKLFGTPMVYRETFLQIQRRLLQHLIRRSSNPWISNVSEHTSPHVMSENQTPDQDQRCQSGPSARNSIIPGEGDSSNNSGADQQQLQISDLHFDKFPYPAKFACWKIRFKTEVRTCSQFPTEAMLWIKEVELFASVDDLRSLCSVRGIQMPNFEGLDAKIASALNRIIYNTQFKKGQCGGTKSTKRGPLSPRKADRLPDLRVLPGHWSQWFRRELCGPIHSCSSNLI